MRTWLQQNRLLILLLGGAVLMGYTHQLTGQILPHHHCVEHTAHDGHDHGGHDHSSHDQDNQDDQSPAGDDSSCACDSCQFVSVTVDLPAHFVALVTIASLAAEANEPAPESPVPALDLPPIISAA